MTSLLSILWLKGYNMLNTVYVLFEDSEYNYATNVSEETTEEKARAYFVGQWFNVDHLGDDMQKCIDIEYIKGLKTN